MRDFRVSGSSQSYGHYDEPATSSSHRQQSSSSRPAHDLQSQRSGRSQDTASAPLAQRRMDSLARLTHSHLHDQYGGDFRNPVATAVGFTTTALGNPAVAVAHNTTSQRQMNIDAQRLDIVKDVLVGELHPDDAATLLAPQSGLPNRRAHGRVKADLHKLQNSYDGRDNNKPGGPELQQQMHDVFHPDGVLMVDHTQAPSRRGLAVHAESALIAAGIPGDIGVSKLSCGDCADYATEHQRQGNLRGTHGESFPNWEHPDSGAVPGHYPSGGYVNQHPSDSDSDYRSR